MSIHDLQTSQPVDRTSAARQARLRAKLGAPVKAYLEPELRDRLDRHAAARHMTLADVLRDALHAYLSAHDQAPRHPVERSAALRPLRDR